MSAFSTRRITSAAVGLVLLGSTAVWSATNHGGSGAERRPSEQPAASVVAAAVDSTPGGPVVLSPGGERRGFLP